MLEVLLLVLIQLILLWSFWQHVDLHIVDEVHYYYRGASLLRGEVSALSLAWGPLYSLSYGLLCLLPLGEVLPLDVMNIVVCVGSTLALWWSVRTFFPAPLPLLTAAWWAASPLLLNSENAMAIQYVYAFGFTLLALAVGAFARKRYWVGAALLVALCLVRIESAVLLLVAGAILLLLSRRDHRRALRWPALLVVTTGLLFLVSTVVHSGVKHRTWLAFKQHHAQVEWVSSGASPVARHQQPYNRPERWIRGDFPTAQTVAQAVLENPSAFGEHVLYNLRGLPGSLVKLCLEGFAHLPPVRVLVLAVAGLLTLVALICRRRELGALFAVCPAPAWALLVAGLGSVPISMLLAARAELMMPLAPLALVVGGCLALGGWRSLRERFERWTAGRAAGRIGRWTGRWTGRWSGRWSGAAAGVLVLITVEVGPPVFAPHATRPLVHRLSASIVRLHMPDHRPQRLLGVHGGSYLKLSGKRSAHKFYDLGIHPETANLPFLQLVKQVRPDFILVTPLVLELQALHPGMSAELASRRWRRVQLRPGYAWLRGR